jgi:hypothetical protein
MVHHNSALPPVSPHNTGLNCSQTGRNGPGGLLPVWPFGVIALFTLRDHAVARAKGEYLNLLFPPFCSSHFFPPTTPCCPSVALLLCTIPHQPSLPFHDLRLVCMITLGFYELMSSSLLLPTHLCLCTAFTSPSRRYPPCHMPMTASTTYCTCTHTPALWLALQSFFPFLLSCNPIVTVPRCRCPLAAVVCCRCCLLLDNL